MYKNYLIVAWRNLWKNKTFSAINITGLALGMSCSLLILLWVQDERAVDAFHVNKDRLYTIIQRAYADHKMGIGYYTPGLLGEEMKKRLPEVEYAANYSNWGNTGTFRAGDKIIKEKGEYADADIFNLFSFPLLEGDKSSALASIGAIAISKKMAGHLFGSPQAAIGQTVRFDNTQDFAVSAVFDDLPAGSSLQFDYLINWKYFTRENDWVKDWNSVGPYTGILLRKDADPALFRSRIKHFLDNLNTKQGDDYRVELDMQRFDEMYLHGDFTNKEIGGGRIEYVRLFSLIVAGLLLIACINFMNLGTARSMKRAKEIGVRKTAGATRAALIRQFIGEAVLCALLAAALAMVLVPVLLPMFNSLSGKHMKLPFGSPGFWLELTGITLLTGLVAGSYPAFFLSGLNPIRALKGGGGRGARGGGNGGGGGGNGGALFRQGLVVFQFVLSLLLILGTLIVSQQVKYIQRKNLGFDRENLVTIPLEGALSKQYSLFKEDTRHIPGIQGVTLLSQGPVQPENYWVNDIYWEGKNRHATPAFALMYTGYDFVSTMHLQLAEGRDFSRAFATDSTGYLLNESAVKKTGLVHPIGQTFTCLGKKGTIIGVIQDFHFNSLHQAIAPLIIAFDEAQGNNILVRTAAGQTAQVLAGLQAECRKLNPEFPFVYAFPDEAYGRLYRSEEVTGRLSYVFSFLAISISCLGLLGLAIFTAEQRSKEIAIRKVLGAGAAALFALLFRGFSRLVLIAFAIAAPCSYWMMGKWLEGYAYRTTVSWWIFPLAGGLALLIAFITVSSQLLKAVLTAPIKSIKAE